MGSCTVYSERLGLRAGRVDIDVHGFNEANIRACEMFSLVDG